MANVGAFASMHARKLGCACRSAGGAASELRAKLATFAAVALLACNLNAC